MPRLNLNLLCSPGSPRSYDPSASASHVSRITGLHHQDCLLFLTYKGLWSQWAHPDNLVWSHVKFLSYPVCICNTVTGSREEDAGNFMEPLRRALETWILWGLPPEVEERWESREECLSSSPGNWVAGAAVEAALIGATSAIPALVAWHFGLVDALAGPIALYWPRFAITEAAALSPSDSSVPPQTGHLFSTIECCTPINFYRAQELAWLRATPVASPWFAGASRRSQPYISKSGSWTSTVHVIRSLREILPRPCPYLSNQHACVEDPEILPHTS